jgi:hypothetical protein
MLDDADRFFEELLAITSEFCRANEIGLAPSLLQEVILYQKLRIPSWPVAPDEEVGFHWNLPAIFEALTSGMPVPKLAFTGESQQCRVVRFRKDQDDKIQYALSRVNKGITLNLSDLYAMEPGDEADAAPSEMGILTRS